MLLGLGLILLISLANLRGIKESGRLFAVPTYVYIFSVSALVLYGLYRTLVVDDISPIVPGNDFIGDNLAGGTLGIFILLKGFSSGAVALTGVEAISNGVPAFRRPESKNAATTLMWMGLILGTLFIGVSVLAHQLRPYPCERPDGVLADRRGGVRERHGHVRAAPVRDGGDPHARGEHRVRGLPAPLVDHRPRRLPAAPAREPRRPTRVLERRARLAVAAGILIVAFGGLTNALIPLYAVGVFLSFTLSQAGMVRHHQKERDARVQAEHRDQRGRARARPLIVLFIVGGTKFTSGAWVPLVVIPLIVLLFKAIKRHYATVAAGLRVDPDFKPRRMNHTVVVLVSNVHRGVLEALAYARSLNPNHLVAVHVVSDEEDQQHIQERWDEFGIDVDLDIVYSPYRELTRPVLRYIDELDARYENDVVTVLIPEFVVSHWWGNLLHGQSALLLKGRLLFRKGTVVTSLPYHLE